MSVTVKLINEGFNRKYLEEKKLTEAPFIDNKWEEPLNRNTIYPESLELLTLEEASKLPENDLRYADKWWVEPNYDNESRYANIIANDGTIDLTPYEVSQSDVAVRPVLTVSNLDDSNLELYNRQYPLFGTKWIYIGDNQFLYNGEVQKCRFDFSSNNYISSEIKNYLDNWLKDLQYIDVNESLKEEYESDVDNNQYLDFDDSDYKPVKDYFIPKFRTEKEVFHNDNGEDYDVIERSKSGQNALLNKGNQWIIAWNCPQDNQGSWGQGHYFFDEESARQVWEDKYLNENLIKENYSIVDLDTGDRFGNYNTEGIARAKAKEYCSLFNASCAIIDDNYGVIGGYDKKGRELKAESCKPRKRSKKLTEGKWNHQLKSGYALRQAIDAEDYLAIKDGLADCYKEIHELMPDEFDENELDDKLSDLEFLDTEPDPEIDIDEQDVEDNWNYELSDFYDLCDALKIWIPLE